MDTIVALATPAGRSAIGIIRMSGPSSLSITRSLLCEDEFRPEPAHPQLKKIRDPNTSAVVDQALVTYFEAPHSFTGEDVVEISCHGSPVILRLVIDSILSLYGRVASPGEFTLRALSNGKIDLSQAEAIRDLINAQTDAAARQAVRQMGGELSSRLQPLKDKLVALIVPLESAVEFVEDDLPQTETEEIGESIERLASEIRVLASTFSHGHLLRDGVRVTLVGRPNSGKSSLFNRLLGTDRAIVTEIAGTTRDTLSEHINLKGFPVMLTDTAGMREPADLIESIGVERTQRAMAEADLLVVVVDGAADLGREDRHFLNRTNERSHLIALNKSDLPMFRDRLTRELDGNSRMVQVSAKTGAGVDELRDAILRPFAAVDACEIGLLITDARHYDLLRRTDVELQSAQRLLRDGASEELVLVGLYGALRFIGEITGETTAEDVLTEIFSTFCIGK
jgi:tRNA modification GTPase